MISKISKDKEWPNLWEKKTQTQSDHQGLSILSGVTWRIIPISKWLVTRIYQPFRPFGRGTTLFRGLTITMVINHLQVLAWSSKYSPLLYKPSDEQSPLPHPRHKSYCRFVQGLPSLKRTFSHLKLDGWKTIVSFWDVFLAGVNC